VDRQIPIQIRPSPEELVRIMVGRIEVLTPDVERRIEKAVADLLVPNPAVRQAAATVLAQLGRIQEPVLHRVAALTTIPAVRTQAQALINKAGSSAP
jgi:hypothetical protein